ncbi:MAG: DsrE family protein [Gammaproteobacteria bacterium]|nr:DsrE family protein [Gammaproteobacteria bacterium]
MVSLGLLAGLSTAVVAAEKLSAPILPKRTHNMVIQLSEDNEKVANLALNNAVNVQKEIGMDDINIEVVAYGPGLKMLVKDSPVAQRIKDLSVQNISFAACGNTAKKWEKDTGVKVELTEGAHMVPAGIVRILELQEHGYGYIRP